MKIIYKTSTAKEQLLSRNMMNCEAVEIQLFDNAEDLELLKLLKKPIHTIHVSYMDNQANINNIINNDLTQIERIFSYASKYNAGIVTHCSEVPINMLSTDKLNRFFTLLNKYPSIPICIENVPYHKEKYGDRTIEIPNDCKQLNDLLGREQFFPLLDICHAVQNINRSIDYVGYTLKTLFDSYNSKYFNIHFNYALGNGEHELHGVTFDSNYELLEEIIHYFQNNEKLDPNLILEVRERDYIVCDNVQHLHNQINMII